jgi:endonuclease/exonuclease/phosphatase family metal-dependent hydrolase
MIGLPPIGQVLQLRESARPTQEAPGKVPSKLVQLVEPLVVKTNPLAPAAPAAPARLNVMTFNVRLGGVDYAGVERTIGEKQPDLVGLQECSRATAEKLARKYGYHLAFYSSVRYNNSIDNGRAILSRFPIQQAESVPYHVPLLERLRNMKHSFDTAKGSVWQRLLGTISLFQQRTLLRATIKVGGKTVDFVDTHLTTGAAATTGEQFGQLTRYVAGRKRLGHEVIVTADFNTHLDRPGTADPSLAGWAGLQREVTDAYGSARRVEIIAEDGRVMTPDEARLALKQPGLSAEARESLKRVSIGASLEHNDSRIDGVLSTSGFTTEKVSIDQQNRASDHQPVMATLDLVS